MDDVDRLFECFKCGISPPESAARKRSKSTPVNGSSSAPSPSSHDLIKKKKRKAADAGSSARDDNCSGNNDARRMGKKQLSPVVFYGSPQGVPPKRPISLLRLLREIRADLAHQDKPPTLREEEVWATFPRQNEAMNFAKEHGRDAHVFSYQDHHSGSRRFLVSRYKEFWKRYKSMDPKFRHHYEVIQEGLPCHLYFDLEFNKRDNLEKNGDEMVDILVSVIFEVLLEKYSIEGNHDWLVELDSSTAEKFSRHLIIRLPKTAFKDNSHAGAFVAEVSSRISSSKGRDGSLGTLFIKKDAVSSESLSHTFVDTGVYSRNRCFRLALSSKAGKTSVLLPTGRFKCKDTCEEDMFMASLICHMDADCEKLLVCKMDLECMKTLHFDTEVNYDVRRGSTHQGLSYYKRVNDSPHEYSTGKSPFPDLDNFVEAIGSIGSISGKIRSWYWISDLALMVYSMSRNRYCERIGREHKSNHVIYVVDLRRGVFYQKCHDPDCQGYRSPLRPIPLHMTLDPSSFCNSVQTVYPLELRNGNLECQFIDENNGGAPIYEDEHVPTSYGKDSWWLEAMRVADSMENNKQINCPSQLDADEDDDKWWTAVESSLCQFELVNCS